MNNRTVTLTVPADRDDVFSFLSGLENLPSWATESCRELRRVGAHWKLCSADGDRYVALLADERTGVIDLLTGEQPDEMAAESWRVVRLPHGAAVTCTLFQSADQADEMFARHYAARVIELRSLGARFGGGEVHAAAGDGTPFYPNLVTAKFYETWDFYTTFLGFRTVAECGVYVHLAHPGGAQLGVLKHETDGSPVELISATDGRGFWVNLDVADADAEHERLRTAGAPIVMPPEDKPWGERMFIVRDPNGVLISIAHRSMVRAGSTSALAI